MTYFVDLSPYSYLQELVRAKTRNIGWLDQKHDFRKAVPCEADIDILWEFCKVSIAQTRGVHPCSICKVDGPVFAQHDGQSLLLGTSEIRVFGDDDEIYSAPTLIFHYMTVHNYLPPNEFMHALRSGVAPPSEKYFGRLKALNLEWGDTSGSGTSPQTFRLEQLPE